MLSYIYTVFSELAHLILGIGTPQSFPAPLGAEEEKKCFERMAEGDEESRQ